MDGYGCTCGSDLREMHERDGAAGYEAVGPSVSCTSCRSSVDSIRFEAWRVRFEPLAQIRVSESAGDVGFMHPAQIRLGPRRKPGAASAGPARPPQARRGRLGRGAGPAGRPAQPGAASASPARLPQPGAVD